MKLMNLVVMTGLSLTVLSSFAQRGRIDDRFDGGDLDRGNTRLELNLGEREFNSNQGEDTVALKALLQQAYGQIDFRNLDLKKVIVQAKSRAGQGQIALLTGQELSYSQTISGNRFEYERRGVGFNRYVFDSRGPEPRGVWQLKLQGNIKISRIVVVVSEAYSRPIPQPAPLYIISARFSSQARCGDLRQVVEKLRNPQQQRAACETAGQQAGGRIYRSAQVNFNDGSSECRDVGDGVLSQICFGFMQSLN